MTRRYRFGDISTRRSHEIVRKDLLGPTTNMPVPGKISISSAVRAFPLEVVTESAILTIARARSASIAASLLKVLSGSVTVIGRRGSGNFGGRPLFRLSIMVTIVTQKYAHKTNFNVKMKCIIFPHGFPEECRR